MFSRMRQVITFSGFVIALALAGMVLAQVEITFTFWGGTFERDAVNRTIEQEKLEGGGSDSAKADVLTAAGRLISVARLIGVFLDPPKSTAGEGDGVANAAMQVLIQVRQHVRKKKDFETADLIRDLLKAESITLEDRADGTIWRKE